MLCQLRHVENRVVCHNVYRISQVLGERLAANADVSDLSDPYKVTKIAEMYVDVYDEQWTEAYEVAEKVFEERDEKYRIRKIIQILGVRHLHYVCIVHE